MPVNMLLSAVDCLLVYLAQCEKGCVGNLRPIGLLHGPLYWFFEKNKHNDTDDNVIAYNPIFQSFKYSSNSCSNQCS